MLRYGTVGCVGGRAPGVFTGVKNLKPHTPQYDRIARRSEKSTRLLPSRPSVLRTRPPVGEEGEDIALTNVVPEGSPIEAGYHKTSMPC